jgi:hypothetical protein
LHWEWIVRCAQKSDDLHNILIVSRDGDFGVVYNNKVILNDWLYREFKERVSKKRSIELTQKLTFALERLNEQVSPADVEEEKKLLLKSEPPTMEGLLDWYESQPNSPEREKFLQNYFSRSVVLPGSLDPEPSN